MKKNIKKFSASLSGNQTGATLISVMLIVIMTALVLVSALKIVPTYMDNSILRSAMEAMIESREVGEMTARELRSNLSQTLNTNNIRDFDLSNVLLIKEKGEEGPHVLINYEARVPIFYNIEAVVIFDNRFEIE